ncbi:MAG: hypothetical protein OXR62_03825 [Ahrensia sp.]|nr:hypothetical protein [Ahrensia sp.]
MTRSLAGALLANITGAALLLSAAFAQTSEEQTDTNDEAATAAPTIPSQAGLDAWEAAYKVFSHPRCVNCHTADEYPRWSGPSYGEARVHGMNVQRGPAGFGMAGMQCITCHGNENSAKLHGPPGNDVWHLAPVEMAWWEKSSAEICEQIKDPERNGGRTLEEVATHIRDDGLVLWGWDPGPGREPAPGSAQETYALIVKWAAEGAPCPLP